MNQKYLKRIILLLGLVLLALTGCLPTSGGAVVTPIPTIILSPGTAEPSATPSATETAEATDTPTATATTAVSDDDSDNDDDPAPVNQDPVVLTVGPTNVRQGPGLNYPVIKTLPGGASTPILGRNANSTWWVIPGADDGSGPVGWIADAVVSVQGDTSNVPFLPAPSLPPTSEPDQDLPIVLDPGAPPSNACVASHPGGNGVVDIYLGPGTQFARIARLGNWVEVLQLENGWAHVLLGPGQTGWLATNTVVLSGPCSEPVDGPILTTIQNTVVYLGPGFDYDAIFELPANQTAEILGRNGNSSWWAISGPGDGPGPYAWVPGDVVAVHGDVSQVPVLTVDPPETAAYPIIDAQTGVLLGAAQGDIWLGSSQAAPHAVNGLTYRLYNRSSYLGDVSNSAPAVPGTVCNIPTVNLTASHGLDGVLAVAGSWNYAPRAPEHLPTDTTIYQEEVAEYLQAQGIVEPEVVLTGVQRVDLEGDGGDEVIISASRLANGISAPGVAAGDYSLVLLRHIIHGQVVITPLAENLFPQANDSVYPIRYSIMAVLDLNGDGRLEIIVQGNRYEGRVVNVYALLSGIMKPVMGNGCMQ